MAVNQSPASTQRPTQVTATLRPSAAPGKPRLVMSHKEAKSFDGQGLLSWYLPFYSERTGHELIHSFKKGL